MPIKNSMKKQKQPNTVKNGLEINKQKLAPVTGASFFIDNQVDVRYSC